MNRRIITIATLFGMSVVAHLAIAQSKPTPHVPAGGAGLPTPGLPGGKGYIPAKPPTKPYPGPDCRKGTKNLACLVPDDAGDTVYLRGIRKSFVVVARFGKEVVDAQVVSGPKAAVQFAASSVQGAKFDVFEINTLGTIDIEGFKPCFPGNGPNNPDCTPVDFPPRTIQLLTNYINNDNRPLP